METIFQTLVGDGNSCCCEAYCGLDTAFQMAAMKLQLY